VRHKKSKNIVTLIFYIQSVTKGLAVLCTKIYQIWLTYNKVMIC